jgi:tRNA threonylcarbamoyladenosine biosynthesis protein TsaB
MKLLAIETATEACSAALLSDGEITERLVVQPRKQSELILGMVDELLATAGISPRELDAVAFGAGPGSFTGVRIATGVAQGIAYGADLPVVPVSTLAAMAQHHFRQSGQRRMLPAFDARMNELYWGCYEVDESRLAQPLLPDRLLPPERVTWLHGGGWHGVGGGWEAYGVILSRRMGDDLQATSPDLLCSAYDVALLGAAQFQDVGGVSAAEASPFYLRDEVAQKPEQKFT